MRDLGEPAAVLVHEVGHLAFALVAGLDPLVLSLWPLQIVFAGRSIRMRLNWALGGPDSYVAVAPTLLPHLAGRPLTLRRFPDGIHGISWHQNECQREPEWLPVYETRVEGGTIFVRR